MRKITIFIVLAVLLTLGVAPVHAAGIPPLPHAFYGDVYINDSPAPPETTVEARGKGVVTGTYNPITITASGKYGSADPLGAKLIVQGEIAKGATIEFYVNGVPAKESAGFDSGETTRLDLTVPATAPSVDTSTATSVTTSRATLKGSLGNLGTALSVDVSFEWGRTTAYGSETTVQAITSTGSFSFALSGLSDGTTYHFKAKADGHGTGYGADKTFTTGVVYVGPGVAAAAPPELPAGTTDVSGKVTTAGRFTRSVTATSEDELCTLTIPRDTVGLTEDLEPLDEIAMVIMDDPPSPPEDANIVGLTYDFGPDGATFDPPITLEYSYDPDDIPEGVAEEDLVIAMWDEEAGEWVELPCTVDPVTHTITASVSHFTTFAVIARVPVPVAVPPVPAPAAFSLSNLTVQPAEVEPKEAVTITVSVANTGGTEGSYSVVLKINGVKEAEKRVTIVAGKSQDISFSVAKEEAGSYSVGVDGLSASFHIAVPPVLPPKPAPPAPAPPAPATNWPVIGGIIAGVVVVGLLIYFLVIRRRAY